MSYICEKCKGDNFDCTCKPTEPTSDQRRDEAMHEAEQRLAQPVGNQPCIYVDANEMFKAGYDAGRADGETISNSIKETHPARYKLLEKYGMRLGIAEGEVSTLVRATEVLPVIERLERELAEKQATIDKMNTTYLAWCEEKRDLDRLTKERDTLLKESEADILAWEKDCEELAQLRAELAKLRDTPGGKRIYSLINQRDEALAEVERLKEELKESKNAYEFLWKMRILDEMERGK